MAGDAVAGLNDKRTLGSIDRRDLLIGAAGAAGALLTAGVAAAQTTNPDTSGEIANRLDAVANILTEAHARLEDINGVLANPPEPDTPISDALLSIKEECAMIDAEANEMLGRV